MTLQLLPGNVRLAVPERREPIRTVRVSLKVFINASVNTIGSGIAFYLNIARQTGEVSTMQQQSLLDGAADRPVDGIRVVEADLTLSRVNIHIDLGWIKADE